MAKPVTERFGNFLLRVSAGASPDVFSAPCGLTSRGIEFSMSTGETIVPDCASEDAVAWVERTMNAASAQISGSGVLAMDSLDEWRSWFEAAEPRTVQVHLQNTTANNGGYWQGDFVLTSFQITGERGGKVQVSISAVNDGKVTWHPLNTVV